MLYASYANLVNKKSCYPFCANHIKTTDLPIDELTKLYEDKLICDKAIYINARTNEIKHNSIYSKNYYFNREDLLRIIKGYEKEVN